MAFDDSYRLSVHAVITNADRQVLQLKQTYGNLGWGLPGGAVDVGETVTQTLLRECKEEIGCDVRLIRLTGIYYHKKFNSHAVIFLVELGPDAIIRLSSEHSEYRYFDLEELSDVQRHRVLDCFTFDGLIKTAAF
jgi:8-oxo-dGTP diphosphatase